LVSNNSLEDLEAWKVIYNFTIEGNEGEDKMKPKKRKFYAYRLEEEGEFYFTKPMYLTSENEWIEGEEMTGEEEFGQTGGGIKGFWVVFVILVVLML